MCQSFDLFSDIFACQENALTRLDPRSKLLFALFLILGVLFSMNPIFPLLILFSCVAVMFLIKIPFRWMLLRMTSPVGVVLVLIFVQGIMGRAAPFWDFQILGWKTALSLGGIQNGLTLGIRVLSAGSVMLLLSLVTPAHRIFHALRWFRVPETWVEVAILVYRHIFVLLDTVADMIAAQRLRLGHADFRKKLSSLGTVAGAALLRSMDQAVCAHEAMTLRGYQGRIPLGPMSPLGWRNRLGILGGALLVCFLYRICGRLI